MSKEKKEVEKVSILKIFWPVFLLSGFQGLAFGGIFILIVPLSSLFWPGEPFHFLEMGILITTLFWGSSIGGLIFGKPIDKYSRIKILFLISIFRGFCMIALGFAIVGKGMETWWYFFVFILIFATFAGGSYPAVFSLANDMIPKDQRSQFFGLQGVTGTLFSVFGFLMAGFLFEAGLWRFFFWIIGASVLIAGIVVIMLLNEPKRGIQHEELKDLLKDDNTSYDFQINKETMRKTMFSKTNKTALIEGIFTNVALGCLTILILPYIQSPPHNFSPFATGVFLVIFGMTGGIIGQILLARLSDKASKEKHIRRIYFIIFALTFILIFNTIIFFLPLPHLSIQEGKNIFLFLDYPVIWIMGIMYFTGSAIGSLYMINQGPILQDINLPEAQGQIMSWNQFLEAIAYGSGPLIAGILFLTLGQNYQIVVMVIALIGIPGVLLWVLTVRWYHEDREVVKEILGERAKILKNRQN